jgi:type I restriction enzyme S subunit
MNKDVMGVQEVSPGYEFVAEHPAVPVGYKQTEVGVIPEDWDAVSLDSISRVTSGKRLPAGYFVTSHVTPHPYIRVSDMYQGGVEPKSIKYVPTGAFPAISQYRIFRDDLFISVAGTLGLVGKIPESLDGANLTENANRISDIQCHQDYLLYVLLSDLVQNTIESIRTVGAQPKLALARIRKFQIPLPPTLEEQRAIATALSDVDALLEELDRLIAKKRDIKQAAMQQLLTGETRLPGFEGEWEVKTLREISRIQRGASPRPIDSPIWFDDNSLIGWVRISDVTSSGMFLEKTSQKLSSLGVQQSRPVPAGSLIMSICATVGRPIVTKVDVCIHDGFVVFDSLEANQLFIFYFLKWIEPKWSQHGQTGSQMNLNTGLINGTEIKLPPMDEQMAIAECLFDMDAEIQALEQRRSKTAELKQGMMQELLTGRTRLV